jgi:hypothetical protein
MNTTSESGFAASSTRSREIRKVARPVPAAAGSIVVALGTGVPSVLGGVPDNHHQALLAATVETVPPERRCPWWRGAAASVLVAGASLALGAVVFSFGSGPGSDHVAKMHLDDITMG